MQQPPTSFLDWTRRFATDEACLAELARRKWPGTFHGASRRAWTSSSSASTGGSGRTSSRPAWSRPPSPMCPSRSGGSTFRGM